MAFNSLITTSLFGRRLGLQAMTTNVTGAQTGTPDMLSGPEDLRLAVSTAETTASHMKAFGLSVLSSAQTAATGAVMRLDPPIPGVRKRIQILSTATGVASTIQWIITASTGGAEVFRGTTWSSSFTVLASSTPVIVDLVGLTTSAWSLLTSSGAFGSAATTTT